MDEKLRNFERLAEKRVTDTIKKIRLIGNLANKGNYSYTESHVRQILEALDTELRVLRNRFKEENIQDNLSFSFKSNRENS